MSRFLSFVFLLVLVISCQKPIQKEVLEYQNIVPKIDINRFVKTIERFEAEDSAAQRAGEVVFYGSSSFVFWKTLNADFPAVKTLNRGFGGSTLPELVHFAPKTILKYNAKKIFVYCGENDLNGPTFMSPAEVLTSFKKLCSDIHNAAPSCKIYFVSIKFSPSRRAFWPQVQQTNQLIKTYCSKTAGVAYVDITKVMQNEIGQPEPKLFLSDSLHMTPLGYQKWQKALKKHVK